MMKDTGELMYNHSIECGYNEILKDSSNQHNDGNNQETLTKLQRYQKSKNEIITKLENNPYIQPHELEKWIFAELPVYLSAFKNRKYKENKI